MAPEKYGGGQGSDHSEHSQSNAKRSGDFMHRRSQFATAYTAAPMRAVSPGKAHIFQPYKETRRGSAIAVTAPAEEVV
jgi:hypothetical protein